MNIDSSATRILLNGGSNQNFDFLIYLFCPNKFYIVDFVNLRLVMGYVGEFGVLFSKSFVNQVKSSNVHFKE